MGTVFVAPGGWRTTSFRHVPFGRGPTLLSLAFRDRLGLRGIMPVIQRCMRSSDGTEDAKDEGAEPHEGTELKALGLTPLLGDDKEDAMVVQPAATSLPPSRRRAQGSAARPGEG
mmetsp:Transcript_112795/g.319067  ORF Transcript_112795/g.319067 Transcript_112795/m.319067 type:complete len:115 (-) Transcript_112795:8-352(-)